MCAVLPAYRGLGLDRKLVQNVLEDLPAVALSRRIVCRMRQA
jgi:ribosomal protein S18 acetylase RimI-like enzyme